MVNKFTGYLKNSIGELKKVIWPSKKEVIKKSGQVVFISLFVALFLGVVDFFLTKIVGVVVK